MIKNTILGYSGFVGNHLLEKVFNTGTYFKTEISSTRFDSNAFEDQFKNIIFL